MNLKDLTLSEISQAPKDKHSVIPLYAVTQVIKLVETESRMVVARDRDREKGTCYSVGLKFQFCRMRKFLRCAAQQSAYS